MSVLIGATTHKIKTFCLTTFYQIALITTAPSINSIILTLDMACYPERQFFYCYAACHFAECRYAEWSEGKLTSLLSASFRYFLLASQVRNILSQVRGNHNKLGEGSGKLGEGSGRLGQVRIACQIQQFLLRKMTLTSFLCIN